MRYSRTPLALGIWIIPVAVCVFVLLVVPWFFTGDSIPTSASSAPAPLSSSILNSTPPSKESSPEVTIESMTQRLLAQQGQGSAPASAVAPWMWVKVANSNPISNFNREFLPGENCLLEKGEHVVVVQFEEERMLLRYPSSNFARGTRCPEGTLFYLSTKRVQSTATSN